MDFVLDGSSCSGVVISNGCCWGSDGRMDLVVGMDFEKVTLVYGRVFEIVLKVIWFSVWCEICLRCEVVAVMVKKELEDLVVC